MRGRRAAGAGDSTSVGARRPNSLRKQEPAKREWTPSPRQKKPPVQLRRCGRRGAKIYLKREDLLHTGAHKIKILWADAALPRG